MVAAAGIDNDRKFAAIHARVGSGGCHRLGAVLHAVAVGGEKDAPDLGTVGIFQPFLGNGGIVRDLPCDRIVD